MLAILSPILVFGLVIFVHELGHFIAAKAVGVYAPRFSIGFGPALFRKRWGETEYVLAVLPLGGYVRMASRLDEDTLRRISQLTGSAYYNAANAADLRTIYATLDPQLVIKPQKTEVTSLFAGAGILVLMLGGLLSLLWLGRLP